MQKWEYLFLEFSGSDKISRVNGGSTFVRGTGFLSLGSNQKVYDVLNSLGEDGWEVVGAGTGNSSMNNGTGFLHSYIISKRPKA